MASGKAQSVAALIDTAVEARLPTDYLADLNALANGIPIIGKFTTTTANRPLDASGMVIHFGSSVNYAVQLAFPVGASGGVWRRGKSAGTWGAWTQIV